MVPCQWPPVSRRDDSNVCITRLPYQVWKICIKTNHEGKLSMGCINHQWRAISLHQILIPQGFGLYVLPQPLTVRPVHYQLVFKRCLFHLRLWFYNAQQ